MSLAIAVCGGTSLGHALAAVFAADRGNEVRVWTRQPSRWSPKIRAIYLDIAEVEGPLALITDNLGEALSGAKLIFVCTPLQTRGTLLQEIALYLGDGAWIGGIPGFGGFEWLASSMLGRRAIIFGLQRVPYVRKTISYGEAVWISGIRPRLFVGTRPASAAPAVAASLQALFSIPTSPLSSYLPVSLSASNAIFHPARLMSCFPAPRFCASPAQGEYFYEDWDNASSIAYLGLDGDIQTIARALGISTSEAEPISKHFGVGSPEELTQCIRNIRALRDRRLPLRGAAWELNRESAYVTEDACFALPTLKALAESAGIQTPWINLALSWTEQACNLSFLVDDRLAGKDSLAIPRPATVQFR
jgi:NAD/NADP octopine/nopaline dehydrogenase, alpha-helical domain